MSFYDSRYTIPNMREIVRKYEETEPPYQSNLLFSRAYFNSMWTGLTEREQNFILKMNRLDYIKATFKQLSLYINVPMCASVQEWFEVTKLIGVDYTLQPNILTISSDIDKLCSQFAYTHLKDFTSLFEAMTAEYDPLQNYNGDEERTTTRTPNITNEKIFGESITNVKSDEVTDVSTNTYGEEVTTNKYGEQFETQQNTTNDSTNFRNRERRKNDEYTDKTTAEEKTDTLKNELGERNTKTTVNGKTDKEKETGTETIVDTFHRAGNLGATSSQNMIEQEKALRTADDFVKIVVEKFIEECCYPYPLYRGVVFNSLANRYIIL